MDTFFILYVTQVSVDASVFGIRNPLWVSANVFATVFGSDSCKRTMGLTLRLRSQ